MRWTAIVPLKSAGSRKSRLSERVAAAERERLSLVLFGHVSGVLARSERISALLVLSPARPEGWGGDWREDQGRGLNPELDEALSGLQEGKLIIHPDLPLLSVVDIDALLETAERSGLAIAPDRHDRGTNALALADGRAFSCCFGEDSFARHQQGSGGAFGIVRRAGLAFDCDTPADLEEALEAGLPLFSRIRAAIAV